MKTLIYSFYIFTLVFSVGNIKGRAAEKNDGKSMKEIVNEIRRTQGIENNEKIDCGKVTDSQFERLGEAFMDIMHPNDDEHELMDRMMGGEESSSLSLAHRNMGARYLGCYNINAFPGMMFGMIGNYGGSNSDGSGWSMMGDYHGWNMMNWAHGGAFMWILIILVVALVVYLIIRASKPADRSGSSDEEPLSFLKKRYAKGEITKEEYEKIKKDLEF